MFLVRLAPLQIFVNCPRYVHKYRRMETSKYVPKEDGTAPLAEWKRLPAIQDVLSPDDREVATKSATVEPCLRRRSLAAFVVSGLGLHVTLSSI